MGRRVVTAPRRAYYSRSAVGHNVAPEVMAMLARRGVEAAAEAAVHGLGCPEAAHLGDLFNRPVGGFQESAGRLEPNGFNVVSSGGAHFGLEHAGELPFGEVDLPGQRGQGEVVGEVVAQP